MSEAYFISPRGKIIPVLHGKHIKQIDADPRCFGLTDSYIGEIIYHNEVASRADCLKGADPF